MADAGDRTTGRRSGIGLSDLAAPALMLQAGCAAGRVVNHLLKEYAQ
jgi:hypothetical protein